MLKGMEEEVQGTGRDEGVPRYSERRRKYKVRG